MTVLKLKPIGNSVGVILPKTTLDRLQLKIGDELQMVETKVGINLNRNDSNFSSYVETAREIMRDYDLTMRELAK